MSITLEWDDAGKTRLRCDFVGLWSCEDLLMALSNTSRLIDVAGHPVDMIVNLKYSGTIHEPTLLRNFRDSSITGSGNTGAIILVGACSITNMIFFIMRQVYPECSLFHVTETVEKARALLVS